ncbi:MAG: phosphonate metabolism protein/1,5-bisphosphokinase (PRPP-forming) PhnN [Betaproteobacteria bacterium]|nr:phosphonate metabolism protein/1,5-bisphosphokinase (PRPP-forming) PhnN [Betaproteobacteria bacterium]
MQAPLIYVVGASGSGKDSLMRYARKKLARHSGVCFAHRYITRPADAGGENHVTLSPDEFAARTQANLFALHWQSHGLSYGIGIEINQWLAKGVTVVVNGSREYLPAARQCFPKLLPVLIEVSEATLRQRLNARSRETSEDIEKRLQRNRDLRSSGSFSAVIRNEDLLESGGEALVSLIQAHSRVLACA